VGGRSVARHPVALSRDSTRSAVTDNLDETKHPNGCPLTTRVPHGKIPTFGSPQPESGGKLVATCPPGGAAVRIRDLRFFRQVRRRARLAPISLDNDGQRSLAY